MPDGPFAPIRRLLETKQVAGFRKSVSPKGHLQTALVELFLQSRFRHYVLAYLSVQEGEAFEGESNYDTNAPQLIDGLLQSVGKETLLTVRPGLWRIRLELNLDPLTSLRTLYALRFPACGPRNPLFRAILKAYAVRMFRMKCGLITGLLRAYSRLFLKRLPVSDKVSLALQSPNGRRLIAVLLMLLFPSAKTFSLTDWNQLFGQINHYFRERLPELLSVIPTESVESNGLIKLAKVFFGTLVGSSACTGRWKTDDVAFVMDSIRLAYSWGITYPLVDNILDSAETPHSVRAEICEEIQSVFEDTTGGSGIPRSSSSPAVLQLRQRLAEVVELIPESNRSSALSILIKLLDVHKRDSARRLNSADELCMADVLADTVQKASLVRLATMEICGISTGPDVIRRCEERGLFNQYGDDLWDIYEDFRDQRVTPFTLFLAKGIGSNPFHYYIQYTLQMTRDMTKRRRVAALMGCAESFRDLSLGLEKSGDDFLHVTHRIQSVLREYGIDDTNTFLEMVPHVDFDAVLFEAENALIHALHPTKHPHPETD
jgi:hypothetical protein